MIVLICAPCNPIIPAKKSSLTISYQVGESRTAEEHLSHQESHDERVSVGTSLAVSLTHTCLSGHTKVPPVVFQALCLHVVKLVEYQALSTVFSALRIMESALSFDQHAALFDIHHCGMCSLEHLCSKLLR